MNFISGDIYQQRINPWLNPNLHLAHSLPISLPSFGSAVITELCLFALEIVIVVCAYFLINLFMSVSGGTHGLTPPSGPDDYSQMKATVTFAVAALIYLRIFYFLIGKLASERMVVVCTVVMLMAIPFMAELLPSLGAYFASREITYAAPATVTLLIWLPISYLFAKKLAVQFRIARQLLSLEKK